jgi:hypothetical protein
MLSDKQLKKNFLKIASKEPDKYYPTKILLKEGFVRNKCDKCSKFFWAIDNERKVCGDASCQGGFTFLTDKSTKTKLSYIDVWKKFEEMFIKFDYKSINRYPVVARWNPTTEFTIASIAAFQPLCSFWRINSTCRKINYSTILFKIWRCSKCWSYNVTYDWFCNDRTTSIYYKRKMESRKSI